MNMPTPIANDEELMARVVEDADYLAQWAAEIAANSGEHSVDAARLRRIAETLDATATLSAENAQLKAEVKIAQEALAMAQSLVCKCPKPLPPGCYGANSETITVDPAALQPKPDARQSKGTGE